HGPVGRQGGRGRREPRAPGGRHGREEDAVSSRHRSDRAEATAAAPETGGPGRGAGREVAPVVRRGVCRGGEDGRPTGRGGAGADPEGDGRTDAGRTRPGSTGDGRACRRREVVRDFSVSGGTRAGCLGGEDE